MAEANGFRETSPKGVVSSSVGPMEVGPAWTLPIEPFAELPPPI